MQRHVPLRHRRAFTLVELIVVVLILSLLAGIAIVGYTQFSDRALQSRAAANLKQLHTSVLVQATLADAPALDRALIIKALSEHFPEGVAPGTLASAEPWKLLGKQDSAPDVQTFAVGFDKGPGTPVTDGPGCRAVVVTYAGGHDAARRMVWGNECGTYEGPASGSVASDCTIEIPSGATPRAVLEDDSLWRDGCGPKVESEGGPGDVPAPEPSDDVPPVPSTPVELPAADATVTQGAVTLSWDAVSGADHYLVHRNGGLVGQSGTPSYVDSAAGPGSHDYEILAVSPSGVILGLSTVRVTVPSGTGPTWTSVTYSPSFGTGTGTGSTGQGFTSVPKTAFGAAAASRSVGVLDSAVDNQGRLVLVGRLTKGSGSSRNDQAFVLRFTADGAVDTSFNTTGYVLYGAGSRTDDLTVFNSVQIDGSDNVIVGGTGTVFNSYLRPRAVLLRYDTDGVRDMAFGGMFDTVQYGGAQPAVWDPSAREAITDLALRADGTFDALMDDRRTGIVARFTANGQPDLTFGAPKRVFSGGLIAGTTPLSGSPLPEAGNSYWHLVPRADGIVEIAGSSPVGRAPGQAGTAVVRFTANGELNTQLGPEGAKLVYPTSMLFTTRVVRTGPDSLAWMAEHGRDGQRVIYQSVDGELDEPRTSTFASTSTSTLQGDLALVGKNLVAVDGKNVETFGLDGSAGARMVLQKEYNIIVPLNDHQAYVVSNGAAPNVEVALVNFN